MIPDLLIEAPQLRLPGEEFDEPIWICDGCLREYGPGWSACVCGRRYWPRFTTAGRCRRCGCTEARACRCGGRRGCHWANDRATLCSCCAERPGRRRFRRRRGRLAFNCGVGWWWRWQFRRELCRKIYHGGLND